MPSRFLPLLALAFASTAAAQRPDSTARRDSSRTQRLEPVVVTAERAATPIASSTAAVTLVTADAARRIPVSTVAGVLELVPGIAVLHSDALGEAPRLAIRGFYGGGETEYVNVLLDGVPLTALATGQVNWDLVPLAALDAIEVVRGGESAQYGDAAVGGVVNLITRRRRGTAASEVWRLEGGQLGTLRAGGAVGGRLGTRAASLFGDIRRTDGWRDHEGRDAGTLGGSLGLLRGERGGLDVSVLEHWRSFEDPGPRTEAEIARSRKAASPFARFDETKEHVHRLTLDGSLFGLGHSYVHGYVTGERVTSDAVRSVPLAATFADAQQRAMNAARVAGSLQLDRSGTLAGMEHHLTIGADLSLGRLLSAYRPVVTGDSAAFANGNGPQGDVTARGRGRRGSVAGFASFDLSPVPVLRLTVSGRVDRIEDRFSPLAPSTGAGFHSTHTAASPRAGANLRWLHTATQTGNVYVTAGRSFKAPTIDQLFDQRAIPVPFPPYAVRTNNPELDPQYGRNLEGGLYHELTLARGLYARSSLAVYQMDMRDELDFDLRQFRYVNIGKSRHRGIEAAIGVDGPASTSGHLSWGRQDATSRYGDNQGKQLKAVPRDALSFSVARAPAHGLGLGVTTTTVSGTWLDDANTRRLPSYTRLDARLSYGFGGARLAVDLRNALDAKYSTTGFPDPAGSPALLLYPAAGRVVLVGVELRR